ncbi:hypothetical protein GON03_10630 [Nocardioides sp. MAH-18]|uniref:Peptidase C39-like domain-containing protein n=1 Tax=Nocardioides agri TaxID=2682843 RepID=A0A6L6XT33_9ACTN|nr:MULTISPECIES: C39 family peptidase [unclassified Nocardioides]MBA2954781.1 C39 family peptidase [Nocardioides sp. CGMCC 1.13656]MVQ49636.1 hypothetical protein [Nocardioides sp. MAH-18]
MARPSHPRWIVVAIGALAVLLALAPLVPRGAEEDNLLRPSRDVEHLRAANAVGASRLTAGMRAEIDRVVAAGRSIRRGGTKGAAVRMGSAVRCADLDGQRYCLGVGWTDDSEAQVRARVVAAARTSARSTRDRTGDLDAAAALARTVRMAPSRRAAAERAELVEAARSVAKVWLLRHELQGTPLPADFLDRHPEARSSAPIAARARSRTAADYPRRSTVLHGRDAREQRRTYWCGPTTMQAIASGWRGHPRRQRYWAHRLGTTRDGTAITDIVRTVNHATGYDRRSRAGRYITLDVGDWSYRQWALLMMRHIHDYRAPVVLHPVLRRRYFTYLDDDASGHFQVGRGYDKNGRGPLLLGYLEPWNQQRFDPSEPFVRRVQWRGAYRSYRANQAHPMHNVGV